MTTRTTGGPCLAAEVEGMEIIGSKA